MQTAEKHLLKKAPLRMQTSSNPLHNTMSDYTGRLHISSLPFHQDISARTLELVEIDVPLPVKKRSDLSLVTNTTSG
jgi:hypothetical protein